MQEFIGDFGRGAATWQRCGEGIASIHFSGANGFPLGSYRSFLDALATDRTLIGLENRGAWPDQPPPAESFCWHDHAEDLIQFLDYQQREGLTSHPIIGIGHSIGASLTWLAALKRPDLFSKLVLIDPALTQGIEEQDSLPMEEYVSMLAKGTLGRRYNWRSQQEFRDYLPGKLLYKDFVESALNDYARAGLMEQDGKYVLRFQPSWESHNLQKSLELHIEFGKLSIPALLIAGGKSGTYQNGVMPNFLEDLSPSIDMKILPNAGHLVPQEAPAPLLDMINNWL